MHSRITSGALKNPNARGLSQASWDSVCVCVWGYGGVPGTDSLRSPQVIPLCSQSGGALLLRKRRDGWWEAQAPKRREGYIRFGWPPLPVLPTIPRRCLAIPVKLNTCVQKALPFGNSYNNEYFLSAYPLWGSFKFLPVWTLFLKDFIYFIF